MSNDEKHEVAEALFNIARALIYGTVSFFCFYHSWCSNNLEEKWVFIALGFLLLK